MIPDVVGGDPFDSVDLTCSPSVGCDPPIRSPDCSVLFSCSMCATQWPPGMEVMCSQHVVLTVPSRLVRFSEAECGSALRRRPELLNNHQGLLSGTPPSDINLLLPHSWGSFFQSSDQDLGLELLCIVGHVLPMFRARRQEDTRGKRNDSFPPSGTAGPLIRKEGPPF